MQQAKPLQPQSTADFRSPLEEARKEIESLRLALTAETKRQQWKTDSRVLDEQLKNRNYREFLKSAGLLEAFREKYPHQ